ncbi:MAG TPA: hypothetical protein VN083_11200 [Vicinamibacteria bacterium]|nr:hypothetical protein [Vicinamibacteria bacterium]
MEDPRLLGEDPTRAQPAFLASALASGLLFLLAPRAAAGPPTPAPAFPERRPDRWIGQPLTWEDLRGKVVLLDIWTFG